MQANTGRLCTWMKLALLSLTTAVMSASSSGAPTLSLATPAATCVGCQQLQDPTDVTLLACAFASNAKSPSQSCRQLPLSGDMHAVLLYNSMQVSAVTSAWQRPLSWVEMTSASTAAECCIVLHLTVTAQHKAVEGVHTMCNTIPSLLFCKVKQNKYCRPVVFAGI